MEYQLIDCGANKYCAILPEFSDPTIAYTDEISLQILTCGPAVTCAGPSATTGVDI